MNTLSCHIFSSLMIKVGDLILFQGSYNIWWGYSPNVTAASQNGVIYLWCNSRLSYHWRKTEQDYSSKATNVSIHMKWVLCDMIYWHHWWKRWEILSCCNKDSVLDGCIHQTSLLLVQMMSLIADSHLIGRTWNRTINPKERMFPSKWSESSVIYLHHWSVM